MRPVPRDELAEAIWGELSPPAWEVALNALVSKLRGLLGGIESRQSTEVRTASGCYQLLLPDDTWVDIEVAADSLDEAEGLLRTHAMRAAWGPATVAATIAHRAFLPAEEGAWVERQRARLHDVLLRALDCRADISLANGEPTLALQTASQAVVLEPFRETGYQRLMRIHAAIGNRAQALRVYQQCRRLLADELGVDPSPQTEALYLELLTAE